MNNIIGNTPYRNIQNKKYIDSTAEYIGKLADFLDKEQIPYSGRISEYKSTITVSGDENFKRASEILDKIKAENPRRFIGNTQYKYIRDKRIIPMDADVIDKIAARLDSEHIMYSGIVEGKKGRITVGGSEIEALVKGYIELERNGSAEIAYEIALTSDAFDDIYYICDQNGNAYYDEDGFAPTFNHVDDAERYAQIHHIPITVDETLMNHWREIEHTDKIRHDNSELVAAFPKSGEEYPDHFLYNAEGKCFQWIYYNPDGNFGEGEFVQKNIYEQDIIAAYNARITSPDEATGRNEFIYSLFSSCEETVISSDTEAFTAIAKEYINKPTGTIELYGIVENGSNISSIDMLISTLEENCPAVHSEKEKTEDIVITENSDEIIIDGYEGTWYVVDTETVDGKELFLLENEGYGDETFGIIIDKDRNVLVDEAWNGFADYHEKYDNITPEEKLANKVEAEWKAFLEDMKKESPAVLIEAAYEISTKDNIQTYMTEENLELTEKQINALLSRDNILEELYEEWNHNEFLNSYSDVEELLKLTADKILSSTITSELDVAKKHIEDYLDSEFSSEADFSDMKHISIGYTEIGSEEQGDHSLQMEADLENYSVSYFIDDELAKTEHYDSLEQMNRDHLSVLNFEDMLHVGTTELDRILEEKEKNVPVTAVLAVSQYDTSRYYIANDITEEAVRNAIANSDKLFMELCALGGTQITEVEFAQYSQTEGIAAIDVNIDEQTMHIYGAENPIVSFKDIKGIDDIAETLDLENNTLTFSVVTIDDEEPFITGNYVGRYDITALDEYQEYIERTGKQFADVNVEFYQIGGDSESVSADDKKCVYISEHLQEVMKHSDALCLESESYSVETPHELLGEEETEQEEVIEHESEIEWTPIPETADDNGRPTSYAAKYNDEMFWISQNPDGKFDIEEEDSQGNFSPINDDFSGFMRRGEAEQYFEENIGEYIAERDEKILDAIVGSITEPTPEQREEIVRKNNTLNSFFNNNPLAVFREIVKSAGLEPTEDITIGDTKEIFNSLKNTDISLMGYTYGLEFEPHDDRLSVTDTASGRTSEFIWGHAKELMYLIANENNISRENLIYNEVMRGTGFVDGKFRVEDFYKTNPEKKDFADFLKKEYGIGGHSGDGPVKFADHDSKGIEITLTTGKENFTWNEVAKVISDLMDKDEYITQKDIDNRIRRAKLTIDNANEHTDFTSLVHAHEVLQKYGIEDPPQDNNTNLQSFYRQSRQVK